MGTTWGGPSFVWGFFPKVRGDLQKNMSNFGLKISFLGILNHSIYAHTAPRPLPERTKRWANFNWSKLTGPFGLPF